MAGYIASRATRFFIDELEKDMASRGLLKLRLLCDRVSLKISLHQQTVQMQAINIDMYCHFHNIAFLLKNCQCTP